jgi:parallel beta-helix repeat protein
MRIFLLAAICTIFICTVQAATIPITGPITITTPGYYVLNSDVLNGPATAYITVRSSGVTIDGNGHILDGVSTSNSSGIQISYPGDSLSNVVIKNLVITDWYYGISCSRCSGGTIEDVQGSNNFIAVDISGSSDVAVKNCNLSKNDNGIAIDYSTRITLSGNTFSNNGRDGASLYQSQALTIDGNIANNNGYCGIDSQRVEQSTFSANHAAHNENGILLYSGDFNNTIVGNVLTANTYGLGIFYGKGNTVVNNQIENNNRGLYLITADNNEIRHNTVTSTSGLGVDITTSPQNNNRIYDNHFNNPNNVNPPYNKDDTNAWSTARVPGTAISGGSYIGGNLWETPGGNGYSQTCSDTTGYGICDTPYTIAPNNVDLYPLKSQTTTVTPLFSITGITPSTGENTGPVSIIDLSGSGFPSPASVKLTQPGKLAITATGITVVNPSKITCNFDLTGRDEGLWDVVVTRPDAQSVTLPKGFTITAPSKTSLTVTSYPSGADLFIDGVQRGTTPATLNGVLPGAHAIAVTKLGYYGYYSEISIPTGQPATVDVTLEPLPIGTGSISVRSIPAGATVLLDGAATGKTTPHDFSGITPGDHTVVLSLPGYVMYSKTVTITPGTIVVVTPPWTLPSRDAVVFISSQPTGATIYIDDQPKGVTDTSLHLQPGTYILRLSKQKYEDNVSVFSVVAGDTVYLSKTLKTPGFDVVLAACALICAGLLFLKRRS